MRRCRPRVTQPTVWFIALLGPCSGCQPSDTSRSDEPPDSDAESTWVEGLQMARRERAELTEAMEARFQVSLAAHTGAVVELALVNLSDLDITEYGGLLHLRDPDGERVCTLWLSEGETVPAGETRRRLYDVEGAFAADSTPVSDLQSSWGPYRIVFANGEAMAKPWPTQSWWPWCQSYLAGRAE